MKLSFLKTIAHFFIVGTIRYFNHPLYAFKCDVHYLRWYIGCLIEYYHHETHRKVRLMGMYCGFGVNREVPRAIRRIFCKTSLHRAWVSGRINLFIRNYYQTYLKRPNP